MSISPAQSVPARTPKRQPYQRPLGNPLAYPGGNSVPTSFIDQSYISPFDASPHRPTGQFVRSHSEITLSPAHLMPPPPLPPSSQFQTPQSLCFSSPSSSDTNYFAPYANYPSNPYLSDMSYPSAERTNEDTMSGYLDFYPRYISDMDTDMMSQSDMMSQTISMSEFDTKTNFSVSMASTSPSKASTSSKTPRPPNAWILYRSDKLKAIAAGEVIPGLEEIAAEIMPGSSASPSNDSGEGEESSTKKSRQRAPKKGAKPPTEGMLSLGKGKLGRGLPQADISKMISLLWKRESPVIRDKYEQMALFKKREHQLKYPDYKFQPQRKADKIRAREEREREREAIKREKEAQKSGRAKKTRSKKNRYSPTATSSRTGSQPYYAPSYESGAESGWQSTGALPTPATEAPLPLPRLNPFPMPPVSLPSMNAESQPGNPFEVIMEPVHESTYLEIPQETSLAPSPERPSTAPEYLPSQMDPELLHPQPTYPLSVPHPQPLPLQPLQQQQQWMAVQATTPQPDQPSIIDIGSEMQMQMQPGQTDYVGVPGPILNEPTPKKSGKSLKKKPKTNAKASQLVATWGIIDEDDDEESTVAANEVIEIDDDDEIQEVLDAQEAREVQEVQCVEQVHKEMMDVKGKKKERPSRAAARPGTSSSRKPLTSTEPLASTTDVDPDYASSDLYHIHAGPYTVETVIPDGQELPAESMEDSGDGSAPVGLTIGQWYDMHKEYNEILVAEPVIGGDAEVRAQAGLSTEINAHIEMQNGHQVIIPDEWDTSQLQILQALIEETNAQDQGPTISGAPLLSPMDATWTLSPTQATFGENIQNDQGVSGTRRVTSFSVTKNDGTLLPFNVVPRHISGYNSPGLGSGSGDGQWTRDRLISFGDAGMIFGGVTQDVPPQMDIYEDDFFNIFMIAPEDLVLPVSSETTSTTSISAPASIGGLEAVAEEVGVVDGDAMEEDEVAAAPASAPSSASSNKTLRVATSPPAPSAPVVQAQRTPTTRSMMRGGLRSRAVGRKFDEA